VSDPEPPLPGLTDIGTGERSPLLVQEGWLRIKKELRSDL